MTFGKTLLQALALTLAFAAPAAAFAGERHMPIGSATLPPAGYVDFCQRQPLDCGADAVVVKAAAAVAQTDLSALNAGVLPASITAPEHTHDLPAAEPKLGPGLWAKLNDVNTRLNHAIRPQTDAAQFGVGDYWQTPLEAGRTSGDCEDFALEKRRALIAAGVPANAIDFALAVIPTGEVHAVLVVSTADGDFVLDNLSSGVRRWDQVPYRWLARSVGGDAFHWATVAAS